MSFELCGPSSKHGTYLWSGAGLTGATDGSCVDVTGLAPGTYEFTLEYGRKGSSTRVCTREVTVVSEAQLCEITGPGRVSPCDEFELCAPDLDGVRFHWDGPGISEKSGRRCISVRGLPPGNHTYTLETRVGGTTVSCEFEVVSGEPEACLITGPARVARDQSFELCGPEGAGWTWAWEGRRIPRGDDTLRCITIPAGLDPGRHDYTLELNTGATVELCTFEVVVVDSSADCFISGPLEVLPGESFELCGPAGAVKYKWDGEGTSKRDRTQCITVDGLTPGRYKFELEVRGADGDEEECGVTVWVRDPAAPALCPLALGFWEQECGRSTRRNGFISDSDLASLAACVDDRSAAFDWPDDLAGFNAVIDGAEGSGLERKLRRQYVVLLANLCAAEMGLLNSQGDSIGVLPETEVSCGKEGTTIGELVTTVEDLLAAGIPTSKSASKDVLRTIDCVTRVNEARGEAFACGRGRSSGGGRWDKDDLRAMSLSDESLGQSLLQLERPTPNPFSATTRIQYAAPQGGTAVEIAVYDLAGRVIQRLARGFWEAGIHEVHWNGTDASGVQVRPGVYFLRGRIGERPIASRLMYLR